MTKWRISVGRGFSVGIGLMSFIILVNAVLIGLAASRPLNFGTFIVGLAVSFGFVLVLLIGYWVYGLASARYLVDRSALIIRWGPSEQVIPTSVIGRVFTGDEVEGVVRFRGGAWPGHWVGYGEIPDLGRALFYATAPPGKQVFVSTPGFTYGISPADREGFLESLRKRLQTSPTRATERYSRRPGFMDWPIWHDWLGLALLGSGSLALIGLIGLLCYRFPSLPLLLPLHFSASGAVDRLGPRVEIFIIPLIGLLTLAGNGAFGGLLYRHERIAGYLLWGGAFLVQMLVWTATLGILWRL